MADGAATPADFQQCRHAMDDISNSRKLNSVLHGVLLRD
jgi:hypothetical protein